MCPVLDPPPYRRRAPFLLATVGRRIESAWSGFLRAEGLTNAEFAAMAVLVDETPSQGLLAEHLGIDPRNSGTLVRRLRERGWVQVERDPDDARRSRLVCTQAGRDAWVGLGGRLGAARADHLGALTAGELRTLERLLAKLDQAQRG